MSKAERCYCIFEGGGAKGIAHIGALSALEAAEFDIVGYAGTSAGAIIAALSAAGYRSAELFSASGSILDRIDRDRSHTYGFEAFKPMVRPERLFGRRGWFAIRVLRFASRIVPWLIGAYVVALIAAAHIAGVGATGTAIMVSAGFLVVLIGVPRLLIGGAASLKSFRDATNQALSLKLRNDRDPAPVTFRDLHEARCQPLKIVATDLTAGRLAIFSYETSPEVAVADAVAASVCLPGIFAPWRVNGSLHYDGGLVSNLPAWAFDAERSIDRDAWTAVIEVVEELRPANALAFLRRVLAERHRKRLHALWTGVAHHVGRMIRRRRTDSGPYGFGVIGALVGTGLFGAGILNKRNVVRLRSVTLKVALGVTEFDVDRTTASEVVEKARQACEAELVFAIDQLPRQMTEICEQIVRSSRILIDSQRELEGGQNFRGQVRAAMLFADGETELSLVQGYSAGYRDHTDEGLRLPVASSLAGQSWRDDDPLYSDRADPGWNQYLNRAQDRWARKLSWTRVQWSLCVPFTHSPSGESLVLALDASEPLGVVEREGLLESLVVEIESVLEAFLPEEAFADGRSG